MFVVQFALTIMCFLSIPLWNKVKEKKEEAGEYDESKVVSIPELLKVPIARSSLVIYFGSCAIESVCLVWCSTFLVNSKDLTPDKAAEMTMLYFIGMTFGRFLSGVLANRVQPKTIIAIGEAITIVAILFTFAKNPVICTAGLFMIGLGNGPVFPNMTHLTPIHMGREVAQSFIGLQGAISYGSILLSPIIFGLLAERFTTDLFAVMKYLMPQRVWQAMILSRVFCARTGK